MFFFMPWVQKRFHEFGIDNFLYVSCKLCPFGFKSDVPVTETIRTWH